MTESHFKGPAQVARLIRAYEKRFPPPKPDPKRGQAERRFEEYVAKNRPGAVIWRSGWPDYLFEEGGRWYGIEVKSSSDGVRPNQARMFDALERMGLRILIWSPKRPDRLVPWRRFRTKQAVKEGRHSGP